MHDKTPFIKEPNVVDISIFSSCYICNMLNPNDSLNWIITLPAYEHERPLVLAIFFINIFKRSCEEKLKLCAQLFVDSVTKGHFPNMD